MHLPSSNVGLILIRSRRWVVIRPAICSACRCLPYDFDDNHHGRRRCSSSSLGHLIVIGPTTMLPGGGGRWYRDILIVGIIPPFGGHGRMIKFRQFLHSSWSSRRSDFLPAALSHSDVVDYDAAPPPCCDASTAREKNVKSFIIRLFIYYDFSFGLHPSSQWLSYCPHYSHHQWTIAHHFG